MPDLLIACATLGQPDSRRCMQSWRSTAAEPESHVWSVVWDMPIIEAYQRVYERNPQHDIIAYLHDDLVISELAWDERVLAEFDDDEVGLVGFAGAPGHGAHDMYKVPYELSQLGRIGFRSNLRDAEQHGARFKGACNVSVLDGMALFVRREVLAKAGGWPRNTPIDYIGYDYWISCVTREVGYRIRLVGVECHHLGGKSTGLNPGLKVDFEGAHRYIYDRFKDVLPARVTE